MNIMNKMTFEGEIKMKNSDIFKLKTYISELETEAEELQNEINILVSKLNTKKKHIDNLKKIISEEEYQQRHKKEESIKDILNKLVDNENCYYNTLCELDKLNKEKFSENDQRDLESAINYLKGKANG